MSDYYELGSLFLIFHSEINPTPFKAPLAEAIITRDTHPARDLLAFTLHTINGTDIISCSNPLPPLSSGVLSVAQIFLDNLGTQRATTGDVDQLALALLKETVNTHTPTGENLRTNPIVLFIMYKSIAPSGIICDPDSIHKGLCIFRVQSPTGSTRP